MARFQPPGATEVDEATSHLLACADALYEAAKAAVPDPALLHLTTGTYGVAHRRLMQAQARASARGGSRAAF
jgi:hypothetical protein